MVYRVVQSTRRRRNSYRPPRVQPIIIQTSQPKQNSNNSNRNRNRNKPKKNNNRKLFNEDSLLFKFLKQNQKQREKTVTQYESFFNKIQALFTLQNYQREIDDQTTLAT